MTIKCLRLIAGEEIIGDVISSEGSYDVRSPAGIHMVPGGHQGQQVSIGLLPWLPYSDDEVFSIAADKVICVHNPSTDLINNYNRLFGSGIQIASAGAFAPA